MCFANFNTVVKSRSGEMLTCFKEMFYLIKDPRISNARAADHDAIYTIFITILQRFFRRSDIPISKNWNFYALIIFYFRDIFPVRGAFVHLCASASMNG